MRCVYVFLLIVMSGLVGYRIGMTQWQVDLSYVDIWTGKIYHRDEFNYTNDYTKWLVTGAMLTSRTIDCAKENQ